MSEDPSLTTSEAFPAEAEARERLTDAIASAAQIVVLSGAGISTESGIPDYRGPGGVWERNAPPMLGDYRDNPETRRAYWQERLQRYPTLAARKPNAGHYALAALERLGRLQAIITQNIDGLHQTAGSSAALVHELHGNTHQLRCFDCNMLWSGAEIQQRLESGETDPHCVNCGGLLRSATVLFGEALPEAPLRRSVQMAQGCELMLVVGTSLVVKPAAQLPVLAKKQGARLVILNRTATPLDHLADIRLYGEAGPTLKRVIRTLP